MTNCRFGDLVPFPFTDQTTAKKRPAVIVSSQDYQSRRPDIILMAVTSQSKPRLAFGEVRIVEWKKAGLLKPSVIKPVMATVEERLVLKKLGRLEEKDRETLRTTLPIILG